MDILRAAAFAALCACLAAAAPARAEPPTFVESPYSPRLYLGDEDARLGRLHLLRGHFGLAERYYRRAVEVTPHNGPAWNGLAAAYDGLGRFDLAERAYRKAEQLLGRDPAVLNNRGYSQMLRGRDRKAASYFRAAQQMAPQQPTITNNLSVLERGQDYFWGDYFWTPGVAAPLR